MAKTNYFSGDPGDDDRSFDEESIFYVSWDGKDNFPSSPYPYHPATANEGFPLSALDGGC